MLCSPAVAYYSMTHGSRKMIAVFVLIAVLCTQGTMVFSQLQQPSYGLQGQGWNPQSWATPYYGAASNSWMDYLKQAQQISNQFMKQWDKSGAANMFAMGLEYAQHAAKDFEKAAASAAATGAQQAQKMPFF